MTVTRIVRRPLPPDIKFPDVMPVLARVYAARQIMSPVQLECEMEYLLPPSRLLGIDTAVDLLVTALRDEQRILIVADFDADGATSCALMVRALRALGAVDVRYIVPNRFQYGYGLTPEIVDVAAQQRPDLIITVDNGISSVDGVAHARSLGIRVLITDHHLPGPQLPAADAIVNPNQPGDLFASKNIAGVGVAFYVMTALRARLRTNGWFNARTEPKLAQLLDLVALGTVADVVSLDHNNRILVAQGLRRINTGRTKPGIKALLEVAGRRAGHLVAADLAFCIAPRLNAAGRLDDMSLGIECLLTDDSETAMQLARRLDELNRARRVIEEQMQQQALGALDGLRLDGELPWGLCLLEDGWHQGVIGIVAGRLKERLHRPVIAFAPAGDDEIKGSARSIANFHIRDALDAIAARYPGLLIKFGGHAMAAGLTLARKDFAAFSAAFDAEARRHLEAAQLHGDILSDGEVPASAMNLALAERVRNGGPWGQGFPEPIFDGEFYVLEQKLLNDKHLKLRLRFLDDDKAIDAIAFRRDTQVPCVPPAKVRVAYKLDVNEYQGYRSLQLVVEHIE